MDYRFEDTAYPLSSTVGGDLVIFEHVAPVGGKVAEVALVSGLLRVLPPLVLLQVGLEARLVRAEAAGKGLGQRRRVFLPEGTFIYDVCRAQKQTNKKAK